MLLVSAAYSDLYNSVYKPFQYQADKIHWNILPLLSFSVYPSVFQMHKAISSVLKY